MTARRLEIRRGALAAMIDTLGATLVGVRIGERDLLAGPGRVAPELGHHGAVLAPWPNRVAGGRFEFAGTSHQLPINDTAHGHAIHGFAFAQVWRLDSRSEAQVALSVTVGPAPGYPFRIELGLSYRVEADTLSCDVEWTNTGADAAPFGIGFHPYLRPGPGPLDDWILQVPAQTARESDAVTKLPGPARPVAGGSADFRTPRAVGAGRFSRAYRLARQDATDAVARLQDPTGSTLELGMSSAFGWVQVFTADLPTPGLRRAGLAVEPQTCPPNAFVSGQDLIRLRPGESGRARWWLRVVG